MFPYLYSNCCLFFFIFYILTAFSPGKISLWMLLSGTQSKAINSYGSYSNCRSFTVDLSGDVHKWWIPKMDGL